MSSKFSKLPKTTFSGLEYQNIIEDIIALVKENPDYSDQYDDFLSSNAGRMLIELFAYITDQLSTRIDYAVNENFLSTATKKSSVIKLLKLIGYTFKLPSSAKVDVSIKNAPQEVVGKYFSKPYEIYEDFVPPFSLTAEDKNGEMKTFELVDPKNYNHPFKIDNSTFVFHEGRTRVEDFFIETENNQTFTLSHPSVIKDSIKVFKIVEGSSAIEFGEVKSFLEPEAQFSVSRKFEEEVSEGIADTYPLPFKINVEENNIVIIEFPPSDIVKNSERRPNVNDQIRVFYRTGGGENGNIVPRSINIDKKITVYNEDGSVFGSPVSLNFINYFYGYEGEDEEDVETASIKAPAEIQTAKKTVTEDDYDAILGSFDEILLSKSIGNSNPIAYSEKLYEKYGKYINPLEVWNFVLTNKNNWEDLDPEEYNDFNWLEARLENRFNELVYFLNGENDIKHEIKSQDLVRTDLIEVSETGGSNLDKIIASDLTYDTSYLGCYVEVKNSKEKENTEETRMIVGGNQNEFFLNSELPKNTTIGDTYTISDPYSYVIKTSDLFKENVDNEDFGVKLTKAKALSSYFNEIEDILVIDEKIDEDTKSISEDVYPYFVSDRNINNLILLDGSLSLNIDGTEKDISFEVGSYSIENIVNKINEKFPPLYGMDDDFYIQGDIEKNSTRIRNINFNIERIRVGMEVSFEGFAATVEEVYIKDKSIVLNYAPSSSSNQKLIYVKEGPSLNENKVASVDISPDGNKYIVLRSYSKGNSSFIKIDGELSYDIFRVNAPFFVRGVKYIYLNEESNLIYRKNSVEPENIYLQYVANFSDSIQIGKEIIGEKEIFNKKKASRVYTTNYNKISKKIDYYNSSFSIKFTKEKVNSPSIQAIEDDWNLKQNSFPEIESKDLSFPLSNIDLRLDINGNPFVINGVAGSNIVEVCSSINTLIREKNLDFYQEYSGFEYAVPNKNRIILRSPTNFSDSKISAEELNSSFFFNSLTENTPVGDYYIKIDDEDNIILYKTENSLIPNFQFYAHFVSDQRYVSGIYDGLEGRDGYKLGSLNEDTIKEKLDIYKITSIDNIFKQPSFKVFDLVGTITYSKSFSAATIEREVNNILYREFSLRNSEIGRSIVKSKIISLIHDIPGVLFFTVDYFGLDRNNPSTNQENIIEADFDEIIVVGKSQNKGLKISYRSE